MEIELSMAGLTARFDDLVDRIAGIANELTQIRTIATNNNAETRAIAGRVEHINGTLSDTVERVGQIETNCWTHKDDSGSWKAVKDELIALRNARALDVAKQQGRDEERDKIKPWRDRAIWALAGTMTLWALLQSANILRVLKIIP